MTYYQGERITLHCGDALAVLRTMADASVDCVVTSPPYFGLRDYGVAGQYGLEASPDEYVETMRAVFREVRRVLAGDGTLWLNIGDSYARGNGQGNAGGNLEGGLRPSFRRDGAAYPARRLGDLPIKSLLGMPWRVAFALQADGWTLRNDIVWHKPNAMPSSVTDRLTNRYEHVFLFARSERYWFDLDAIREPLVRPGVRNVIGDNAAGAGDIGATFRTRGGHRSGYGAKAYGVTGMAAQAEMGATGKRHGARGHAAGKNPGDMWSISTRPFGEAHFAVFPPQLVERCVLAGCRPGGVVLDPFCGSGTTGMVALKLGRSFVGIDLSADYLDLALRTRLAGERR